MLFSILLVPVIGLLLSVGDKSQSLKLALLGSLGASLLYDFMHSKRRSRPLKCKFYIISIITFQAYLTYSWLDVYFSKPIGLELTRFMLAILAGSPWIAIWQVLATESRSPRILGLPPTGLGVLAWSFFATVLSRLGVGSDSSMLTYGRVVEGGVMGEFRSILPGFPGIVAGGVFCGIALVYAISGILVPNSTTNRALFAFAGAIAAYGIYITDVRSATGVSIVALLIGLFWTWIIKSNNVSSGSALASITRKLVIATGALPFMVPLLIPVLDSWTERVTIPFSANVVARSEAESLLSFGGRSRVWEVSTELAMSEKFSLFSFNSVGEFGAGVSYALFDAVIMPGTPESAHSHNAALNFYYSFGLFGLMILVVLIGNFCIQIVRSPVAKAQVVYLLPFFGFMVFMTLESLLSVSYTYFGLCFTLFNLDSFREANSDLARRN